MLLISSKREGGNQGGGNRGREPREEMRGENRNEMRGEMRGEYRAEMRGNGGEMRQHYPMPYMPHVPPYGEDEPEMRGGYEEMESRNRRRYKNGRFAPRSEIGFEMRYEEPEMRGGNLGDVRTPPDVRQPNQIGFRYEEDPTRYRTDGSYMRMNEGESRTGKMERGGASSKKQKLDKETAEKWTAQMQNADGSMGPHWTMEQTKQVMQSKHIDVEPVEFYVVMNMLFSDFSQITKTHGVNSVDFYADMAKAFLEDKDAVEDKLMSYYEYIVKH